MLYSEFVEGTGCRETDYNYQVYKAIEMLYTTVDRMSKEDAYKLGKKYIDNSLTPELVQHNNEVQAEIDQLQEEIENMQSWLNITYYGDKLTIKNYERDIKANKEKIKLLKTCFAK